MQVLLGTFGICSGKSLCQIMTVFPKVGWCIFANQIIAKSTIGLFNFLIKDTFYSIFYFQKVLFPQIIGNLFVYLFIFEKEVTFLALSCLELTM